MIQRKKIALDFERLMTLQESKNEDEAKEEDGELLAALKAESFEDGAASTVDKIIRNLLHDWDRKTDQERYDLLFSAIQYLRRCSTFLNGGASGSEPKLRQDMLSSVSELNNQSKKLAHMPSDGRKGFFEDAMIVTCRLIFKAQYPTHDNNLSGRVNNVRGKEAVERLGVSRRSQAVLRMAFGTALICGAVASVLFVPGLVIPAVIAVAAFVYSVHERKQPQRQSQRSHKLYGAKRLGATAAGSTATALAVLSPAAVASGIATNAVATLATVGQAAGVVVVPVFASVTGAFAVRKGLYQLFNKTNRGVRKAAGKAFDTNLEPEKKESSVSRTPGAEDLVRSTLNSVDSQNFDTPAKHPIDQYERFGTPPVLTPFK